MKLNKVMPTDDLARLLPIIAVLSVGWCIGPEHYYGRYDVSCSGPANVHDEVEHAAALISTRLKRPITPITSGQRDGDLTLVIGAPPVPSIAFSYSVLSPARFGISVAAPAPVEDSATHDARAVIENVLRNSPCADWRYGISHTSLAGG